MKLEDVVYGMAVIAGVLFVAWAFVISIKLGG